MSDKNKAGSPGLEAPGPAGELLIAADGTILAHNLFPELAEVLLELNPKDEGLRARVEAFREGKRVRERPPSPWPSPPGEG